MQNSAVEIQFPLNTTGPRRKESSPHEVNRSEIGRVPRVTQVMALVIQLQDMIERGDARDYADLARLGCLTRERMSQIMELVWLAPDIQKEILEFPPNERGRFPVSEVAARRVAEKLDWAEQRGLWSNIKKKHHLE
jgi:hypothetical protein